MEERLSFHLRRSEHTNFVVGTCLHLCWARGWLELHRDCPKSDLLRSWMCAGYSSKAERPTPCKEMRQSSEKWQVHQLPNQSDRRMCRHRDQPRKTAFFNWPGCGGGEGAADAKGFSRLPAVALRRAATLAPDDCFYFDGSVLYFFSSFFFPLQMYSNKP